jgi:hypothetical protein
VHSTDRRHCGARVRRQRQRLTHEGEQRRQSGVALLGKAATHPSRWSFDLGSTEKFSGDRRFANAGLACEKHGCNGTSAGIVPRLIEDLQFLLTTDEGDLRFRSLKLASTSRDDRKRRFGAWPLRFARGELEAGATREQARGRWTRVNNARTPMSAQPQRSILRDSIREPVVRHRHRPCVDGPTELHLRGDARAVDQSRTCMLGDLESGARGSNCGAVARVGITKIDEHSTREGARDPAPMALNNLLRRSLQILHQLLERFLLAVGRCRTPQIHATAEHGHLASLSSNEHPGVRRPGIGTFAWSTRGHPTVSLDRSYEACDMQATQLLVEGDGISAPRRCILAKNAPQERTEWTLHDGRGD